MNALIISLIRTIVPVIVGAVVTWLLSIGLSLDTAAQNGLTEFLFALITGLYYLIVRLLERKWPGVGLLLGVAAAPISYKGTNASDPKPVTEPLEGNNSSAVG